MKQPILIAFIALIIGVGIGLGVATLMHDDTPAPAPMARETQTNTKVEHIDEVPTRKAPTPDVKPAPRENPSKAPVPTAEEESSEGPNAGLRYQLTDADLAESAKIMGIEASDKTITGLVRDADGNPVAGATIYALAHLDRYTELPGGERGRVLEKNDSADLNLVELYAGEGSTLLGRTMMGLARKARSDANGRFEFTKLYKTDYRIGVLSAGGMVGRDATVTALPGDEVNLTMARDRKLNVVLRLPDGSSPSAAYVEVRAAGDDAHRGAYYRWSPSDPSIPASSDFVVLGAIAQDGHHRAASRTIDIRTLGAGLSITLELEALTGLELKINRPAGKLGAMAQASFFVAPLDQSFATADALTQSAKRLYGGDSIIDTSLEAGAYFLYMVRGPKILIKQALDVVAGSITQAELTMPPLAPEDFVTVNVKGLTPDLIGQLRFNIQVKKKYSNSGYQAQFVRDGESFKVIMVESGRGWSQSGEPSHGGEQPSEPDPESYTITAEVRSYGEVSSPFTPGSGQTITLEFPARATLLLQVHGYDPKDSKGESALFIMDVSDPENREQVMYTDLDGAIDGSGMVVIPNLAVGSFELELRVRRESGSDDRLVFPITLVEGGNKMEVTIPKSYPLKINVPHQEGLTNVRVTLFRGNEHIDQKFTVVKANQDNFADFGEMSAGEYRAEIRIGNKTMEMTFNHQSDSPQLFMGSEKR